MEIVLIICMFSISILRWILIIYFLMIIIYKFIKKYIIKDMSINFIENQIYILTYTNNVINVIKSHMNKMDEIYYPQYIRIYKNKYLKYINGSLILGIAILWINTFFEIFYNTSFNITNYMHFLMCLITINISILLFIDLYYKYKYINNYIDKTRVELNEKLNIFLCGNLPNDHPANPVDWKVKTAARYAFEHKYHEKLGKGMAKGSTFIMICSTCIMLLWGHHELYKDIYPHKIPPLVKIGIYTDPPTTLEGWDALKVRHPGIIEHPKYIEFHKTKVMDIDPLNP